MPYLLFVLQTLVVTLKSCVLPQSSVVGYVYVDGLPSFGEGKYLVADVRKFSVNCVSEVPANNRTQFSHFRSPLRFLCEVFFFFFSLARLKLVDSLLALCVGTLPVGLLLYPQLCRVVAIELLLECVKPMGARGEGGRGELLKIEVFFLMLSGRDKCLRENVEARGTAAAM